MKINLPEINADVRIKATTLELDFEQDALEFNHQRSLDAVMLVIHQIVDQTVQGDIEGERELLLLALIEKILASMSMAPRSQVISHFIAKRLK